MIGKSKRDQLREIRQYEDGSLAYTGRYYRLSGTEEEKRALRLRLAAAALFLTASVIGSGCIDAAGATGAFYVILPYIGEVSALFVLLWNLIRLTGQRGRIRSYVYSSVSGRILGACGGLGRRLFGGSTALPLGRLRALGLGVGGMVGRLRVGAFRVRAAAIDGFNGGRP